jgi:hypothetical protein
MLINLLLLLRVFKKWANRGPSLNLIAYLF